MLQFYPLRFADIVAGLVGFVNDYWRGMLLVRKATARVPTHPPLIPRLYYDYDAAPQAVHSRGGGGCGGGRGPLRSPCPPILANNYLQTLQCSAPYKPLTSILNVFCEAPIMESCPLGRHIIALGELRLMNTPLV